jgi:hypothetical protein
LLAAGERHGLAGGVGAGGDEVDDVAVELAVGVGLFGRVVLRWELVWTFDRELNR